MHSVRLVLLATLALSGCVGSHSTDNTTDKTAGAWDDWWSYRGISGPAYWGLINPEWSFCNKGKRQSPINIDPQKLLFDPQLTPIEIGKQKVNGTLTNTGQSLVFRVDSNNTQHVNITGGPLAYRYQVQEVVFHYGTVKNQHGSEHRIHGYTFPAEIQLYGFNAELYHNMSEAQQKPHGVVGISLLVQVSDSLLPNPELTLITSYFTRVMYKGSSRQILDVSISSLLPNASHYMTYEGSTTQPGCWETVDWVIINKPVYVTKQLMYTMRKLMSGSPESPVNPLGDNNRPLQPLLHRTVRTNIDFQRTDVDSAQEAPCSCCEKEEFYYKSNPLLASQSEVPDARSILRSD